MPTPHLDWRLHKYLSFDRTSTFAMGPAHLKCATFSSRRPLLPPLGLCRRGGASTKVSSALQPAWRSISCPHHIACDPHQSQQLGTQFLIPGAAPAGSTQQLLSPDAAELATNVYSAASAAGAELQQGASHVSETVQWLAAQWGREQAAANRVLAPAVDAAGDAVAQTVAPFDVFDGAWFMNVLLVGTVALLAYSLAIAAPKQ